MAFFKRLWWLPGYSIAAIYLICYSTQSLIEILEIIIALNTIFSYVCTDDQVSLFLTSFGVTGRGLESISAAYERRQCRPLNKSAGVWAFGRSGPRAAPRQSSGTAVAVPLAIRTLPVFTVIKIAAPLWKKLNRVAEINDWAKHETDSYKTYIISLMSKSCYKILDVIFIWALVDQEQYSRQNLCPANQPITEQLWSKEGGAILCFCFDSMTRQPRPQRRDHLA